MTNEQYNSTNQSNAEKPKVAVFASGTGSNFQAMLKDPLVAKHIALLVCDHPGASVTDIAKQHDILSFVFAPQEFEDKEHYEREITQKLRKIDVEWIFLAGYMRIVGETLLSIFQGKIVNIHPSYLPAFPGKDAIGQAMRAKVKTTGVTVHYVDEGIDTGPIIEQEMVEVLPEDSLETLTERIQQVEHKLYPKVMKQLMGVW